MYTQTVHVNTVVQQTIQHWDEHTLHENQWHERALWLRIIRSQASHTTFSFSFIKVTFFLLLIFILPVLSIFFGCYCWWWWWYGGAEGIGCMGRQSHWRSDLHSSHTTFHQGSSIVFHQVSIQCDGHWKIYFYQPNVFSQYRVNT